MNRRHFIHGWRQTTVAQQKAYGLEKSPLDHCASNVYGKLKKGDYLWLVAMKAGRVSLLHRFILRENPRSFAEAARRFRARKLPYQPWDAKYQVFGKGTRMLEIDITRLAMKFVFERGRTAVKVRDDGLIDNQCFRSMRELSLGSAALLEGVLKK